MNFYETPEYGSTYLLPCYCILRSLEVDMQHGNIPKKLNFGLSPTLYVHTGDQTKSFKLKSHLICSIFIVPLPVKRLDRFGKVLTIDLVIEKNLND